MKRCRGCALCIRQRLAQPAPHRGLIHYHQHRFCGVCTHGAQDARHAGERVGLEKYLADGHHLTRWIARDAADGIPECFTVSGIVREFHGMFPGFLATNETN